MDVYESIVSPLHTEKGEVQSEDITSHQAVIDFIHKEAIKLKPKNLVMKDLKWKFLVRSAVRAKNIMMVGPTGCGKTMAAKALTKALDRPDFYFNLGATQDPRATLIGNTQFSKEKGTFFAESAFVTAIQTPNADILLDELTRDFLKEHFAKIVSEDRSRAKYIVEAVEMVKSKVQVDESFKKYLDEIERLMLAVLV